MEIKDLAGLSQPLTKLVEVIASAVGNISRPFLLKRNADAKAYEIKRIAEALNDSKKLLGTVEYNNEGLSIASAGDIPQVLQSEKTIEDRALDRAAFQEVKKQRNIEQISRNAAEELIEKEVVSDEKVDEDWISRFFSIAENISSDEMQILWGKVLAGEVSKPGSYSLRTLDTLKNLTRAEAELFVKVAQFALFSNGMAFIVNPDNNCKFLTDHFNVGFTDLLVLKELGLLLPSENLVFNLEPSGEQQSQVAFLYGNTCILIARDSGIPKQSLPIALYSTIGQELLPLVSVEPNIRYIEKVASLLKREGVTVKYGEVVSRDGNQMQIRNVKEVTETADA
jgi:uncharacterized repeat protein (TIGR03899 family)